MNGSPEPLEELFHRLRALPAAEREPRIRDEERRDPARGARLRALLAADAAPTADVFREGARPGARAEEAFIGSVLQRGGTWFGRRT